MKAFHLACVLVLALASGCIIETVPLPEERAPLGGDSRSGGRDDGYGNDQPGDVSPSAQGDTALPGGDSEQGYEDWLSCGYFDAGQEETLVAGECLCDGANRCLPVSGMRWLPLGSERFRVCGIEEGECVIATFVETEGSGSYSRCRVPLGTRVCEEVPLTIDDFAARCDEAVTCNLLTGECPLDPLACE